jgi:RimJ/RimL family protein N-acetyltransferase
MLSLDLGGGAELRALEPWQAEEFLAHMDSVREYLRPHISLPERVKDLDEARGVLRRYAEMQLSDTGRIYGIWLDGTLRGGIMFRHFDAAGGTCEIGVWLAPEAQGRGLMTTAVRKMIDWAIGVRGIGRVEWLATTDNERSIAVAKRVGMTYEGIKRSDYILNGERRDSAVYSFTIGDWAVSDRSAGNRSGTS